MPIKPLNRVLYNRLCRLFANAGGVVVANQGEKMISAYAESFKVRGTRHRGPELRVDYPGEYYRVNCPYCNDRRHRLWVNHMWGVKDAVIGDRNLWLAICYNENCLGRDDRRLDLYEDVFAMEGHFQPIEPRVIPGRKPSEMGKIDIEMPGPTITLDRLEPNHPANRYLAERGFVPERLGRFYKAGYCSESIHWLARHRIVVPAFLSGKLVGWQTRYIGEQDWKEVDEPKWWTCPGMKTGRTLYNFDEARKYKTGVVMEGVADIWAFGPMGMGTFSSVIGPHQIEMVAKIFKYGSLVLMPDPGIWAEEGKPEKLERARKELQTRIKHGVSVVRLPDNTDPGSLERSFTRQFVVDESEKQGVPVSFQKRSS